MGIPLTSGFESLGGESPAADLVGMLPGLPDEKGWKAHLQRANQERIRDQAEEQKAARKRIDDWLKATLADGPILDQRVVDRAKEQGFMISRHPYEAHLAASRERLGVLLVYHSEDPNKATWWALPGRFDKGRWTLFGEGFAPASAVKG